MRWRHLPYTTTTTIVDHLHTVFLWQFLWFLAQRLKINSIVSCVRAYVCACVCVLFVCACVSAWESFTCADEELYVESSMWQSLPSFGRSCYRCWKPEAKNQTPLRLSSADFFNKFCCSSEIAQFSSSQRHWRIFFHSKYLETTAPRFSCGGRSILKNWWLYFLV